MLCSRSLGEYCSACRAPFSAHQYMEQTKLYCNAYTDTVRSLQKDGQISPKHVFDSACGTEKEALTLKACRKTVSFGSSKVVTNFLAATSALFRAFLISSSLSRIDLTALSISLVIDDSCAICVGTVMVINVAGIVLEDEGDVCF